MNCEIQFLKNAENILLLKSRIEIVPLNNSGWKNCVLAKFMLCL